MTPEQLHPSTEAVDAALVQTFVNQSGGRTTRELAQELLDEMGKEDPDGIHQIREQMLPTLNAAYQVDLKARLAQAWEEGCNMGTGFGMAAFLNPHGAPRPTNPYREDSEVPSDS